MIKRPSSGSFSGYERAWLLENGLCDDETQHPMVIFISNSHMEQFYGWLRDIQGIGRWVMYDAGGAYFYFPRIEDYTIAKLKWVGYK